MPPQGCKAVKLTITRHLVTMHIISPVCILLLTSCTADCRFDFWPQKDIDSLLGIPVSNLIFVQCAAPGEQRLSSWWPILGDGVSSVRCSPSFPQGLHRTCRSDKGARAEQLDNICYFHIRHTKGLVVPAYKPGHKSNLGMGQHARFMGNQQTLLGE